MAAYYTLEKYIADLREIAGSAADEDEIFRRLGPLASRLALDKSWLKPEHRAVNPEQGFGVHLLYEQPDHDLAVLVVNWLPDRGAPPHDHGTWAVVAGVEGVERNISYARTDDRARPDNARLEIKKETDAGPGDLICMKTGGIHEVRNLSGKTAISLHTYGRHLNHTGRSQFDAETGAVKEFIVQVA